MGKNINGSFVRWTKLESVGSDNRYAPALMGCSRIEEHETTHAALYCANSDGWVLKVDLVINLGAVGAAFVVFLPLRPFRMRSQNTYST